MPVGVVTLDQARHIVTVFHSFALAATFFRVFERARTRRLWWDDFWVAFASIMDVLFLATIWLRSATAGKAPPALKRKYILLHWFAITIAPTVLWSARLSILFTIKRVLPPGRRFEMIIGTLAVSFGFMWALVVSEKIWVCTHDVSWHKSPSVQCFLGQAVPITELVVSLISDGLLVIVPLHALWRVRLPAGQRQLVLSVFATSILTLLAGIVYIVFVFGSMKWKTFIMVTVAAHIEATIAMMVCNLLVIVSFIYRLRQRSGASTTAPSEPPVDYVSPWGFKRETTAKTVSMSFPTAGRSDVTYGSTFDLQNMSTKDDHGRSEIRSGQGFDTEKSDEEHDKSRLAYHSQDV